MLNLNALIVLTQKALFYFFDNHIIMTGTKKAMINIPNTANASSGFVSKASPTKTSAVMGTNIPKKVAMLNFNAFIDVKPAQ